MDAGIWNLRCRNCGRVFEVELGDEDSILSCV